MKLYTSIIDKNNYFKDNRTINNTEILDLFIKELDENSKTKTDHLVFRGLNESKYALYNSFQRKWFDRDLKTINFNPVERITSVLQDFQNKKNPYFNYLKRLGVLYNDWLVLSMMQHYSAPSPLLDFSKDPRVALYFACKDVNYKYSNIEIDNYVSIYYIKIMEILRDFTNVKSILNIAKDILQNYDFTDIKTIWLKELSFSQITNTYPNDTLIIPSYSNVSKLKSKVDNNETTYTIANMNLTSQDGEFICNLSMDKSLEDIFINNGKKYISCVNIHKGLIDYLIKRHLGGSIENATFKYFLTEKDIAKAAGDKLFSLD